MDGFEKLRVLVTGGSGFLGSHIAEQLARAGHEVVALVRKTSNRKFLSGLPDLTFAYGSVEDPDAVAKAVQGVQAIVHAAGLVKALSPEEFETVNVRGTENLLEAAKRHVPNLKRFVFISSLAAVGPSEDGRPKGAHEEPHPVTHYGRSKLKAERAVLAQKDNLPVTVIRPPMIYGPRDTETFAFFQTVSRRVLPYLGDGTNTLSIIYGGDAAAAAIRAIFADVPSGKCYFVEDGRIYVWREMLAELERVLDRRALLRFGLPFFVLQGAATVTEGLGKLRKKPVMLTRDKLNELRAPHWVCDASDTRSDLGWTPEVDWSQGARKAAEWYREAGWL
jgi:2-alkyl-3-oxoalkanoate reductase